MTRLKSRILALVREYLDQWLLLQMTQRPVEKAPSGDKAGIVMVCGSCARKKAAMTQQPLAGL